MLFRSKLIKNVTVFGALLFSQSFSLPNEISVSDKGAWDNGVYRNLFVEMGKTQEEVDKKVNSAFQQLFFGTATQRVYYEVGSDMGFIKDIYNNDIRSEGMSYGMMIAVQMNRQDVFDKLWKFAKTFMQHSEDTRKGYFSWQLKAEEPYDMMDLNSAPDGEEYFVMSLFFASKRWGDKNGIFAYSDEANAILKEMIHKPENSSIVPMMNPTYKMIEFSPDIHNDRFTDPSYHLPSFYQLWSYWASSDNEYWQEVTNISRNYFKKACHPITGLATEYQAFDGTPQITSFNANSATFNGDSWRVAMNIAMDYSWFKADEWQVDVSEKMLTFFNDQGDYKSGYEQDGSKATVTYQSEGHVAMNAVAALASNDPIAWRFVNDLWNKPIATGTYRYYNGLLQMLAWLNCSGNYKIWGSSSLPTHSVIKKSVNGTIKNFNKRLKVNSNSIITNYNNKMYDTSGRNRNSGAYGHKSN